MGYINGYSERLQVIIPAKKKVSRYIEEICKQNKVIKSWLAVPAFILLV